MDANSLLYAAALVLTFVGGFLIERFLPSYFSEKGKNLATKEDIKGITDKIESVRADYARRSHVHEMTFDHEFEILAEAWKALVDLRAATQSLRPIGDYSLGEDETEEDRKKQRLQKFHASQSTFRSVVEKHQPFYPQEIYDSLFELMMIAYDEADEYGIRDSEKRPLDRAYWQSALNNQKQILALAEKICSQIRARIVA